ncbi:hypothetical protein [Phyllobacterium sp. P30BS-XVII]|uniref:hypothetical protein n=1 Tax=Phyllobacterium sp. P30BS-XVII TaxID=2587046 RepID=UPI0015F8B0DC|nr:hypothetical protein [Phyllobacterium sp. P30BS-XVII]MBA8904156.1 hypothetical protein [Phyllobacterium sp. P30BS-XVII]
MKQKIRLMMTTVLVAMSVSSLPVAAADGYKFNLVLSHKNVQHDPDGIWPDTDLTEFGNPPRLPSIYTARLETPAGKWLLSQLDSSCNIQGNCSFVLQLTRPDGKVQTMAEGQTLLGRSATLSLNYKKITTEEISDEIKPFVGSYDVEPMK